MAAGFLLGSVVPTKAQSNSPDAAGNGLQIYKQAGCYVCHGELGFGSAGPRLRDNPFLVINDYVVGQILIGRGIMPSFANRLSDAQIAAVSSYIRNSWGNHFGAVSAQQVAGVRQMFTQKFPNTPLQNLQQTAPAMAPSQNGGVKQ